MRMIGGDIRKSLRLNEIGSQKSERNTQNYQKILFSHKS